MSFSAEDSCFIALRYVPIHTLCLPRRYGTQDAISDRNHSASTSSGHGSLENDGNSLIVSQGVFKDAIIQAIREWCREPSQELINSLDAIQLMQRENSSTRLPSSSRRDSGGGEDYMAVEVDEDGVPRTFSQYEANIQNHQNGVRLASKEVIDRLSIGLDIVQVINAGGKVVSSEKQASKQANTLDSLVWEIHNDPKIWTRELTKTNIVCANAGMLSGRVPSRQGHGFRNEFGSGALYEALGES